MSDIFEAFKGYDPYGLNEPICEHEHIQKDGKLYYCPDCKKTLVKTLK